MSIVIFDLDGTLANIDHRLHYVQNGNRNYSEFFRQCVYDTPVESVCQLARLLWMIEDIKIYIVSGRSDEVREQTEKWLFSNNVPYSELLMRKAGDYRPDQIIKLEILEKIRETGDDILFTVDDRQRVVDMWRAQGLTCFQCATWKEFQTTPTTLTLLIGPSGAGKTTFLQSSKAEALGILSTHVVSSDDIRKDVCGDFREQSKNKLVFQILHELVKSRLELGLPTVVDATNIKFADRKSLRELAKGHNIRYLVINRTMEQKRQSGGWRNELAFDLMQRHEDTFIANLPEILRGDGDQRIEVIDLRESHGG